MHITIQIFVLAHSLFWVALLNYNFTFLKGCFLAVGEPIRDLLIFVYFLITRALSLSVIPKLYFYHPKDDKT
jgi:hypothetical protein